jgi:hypothetical protein
VKKKIKIKIKLTSISLLQPNPTDVINICDNAGSSGNSTICRPNCVNEPVLSNAPNIHN